MTQESHQRKLLEAIRTVFSFVVQFPPYHNTWISAKGYTAIIHHELGLPNNSFPADQLVLALGERSLVKYETAACYSSVHRKFYKPMGGKRLYCYYVTGSNEPCPTYPFGDKWYYHINNNPVPDTSLCDEVVSKALSSTITTLIVTAVNSSTSEKIDANGVTNIPISASNKNADADAEISPQRAPKLKKPPTPSSTGRKHVSKKVRTLYEDDLTPPQCIQYHVRRELFPVHALHTCTGYSGEQYNKIILMSLSHELSVSSSKHENSCGSDFALTPLLSEMKGYNDMVIRVTQKREIVVFKIISKTCQQKYQQNTSQVCCRSCDALSKNLNQMVYVLKREQSGTKYGQITLRQIAAAVDCPQILYDRIQEMCRERSNEVKNLSHRIQRMHQIQQEQHENASVSIAHEDEHQKLVAAINILIPAVEKKLGKDTNEAKLLIHSIRMIKFPVGHKGAHYPKDVMDLISVIEMGTRDKVYDLLKKSYHFASKKHVDRVIRSAVNEGSSTNGPCERMIASQATALGASLDSPVHVIVSFDGVSVSTDGSVILSNRKEDKGRLKVLVQLDAEIDVMSAFQKAAHKFYSDDELQAEVQYYGWSENDVRLDVVLDKLLNYVLI